MVADLCLGDPACSHLPAPPGSLRARAPAPQLSAWSRWQSQGRDPRTQPGGQRAIGCSRTALFPRSLQGMGYLHAKGILHKDLKSKNVFYDNGKVVITDFGLFSISGVLQAGR